MVPGRSVREKDGTRTKLRTGSLCGRLLISIDKAKEAIKKGLKQITATQKLIKVTDRSQFALLGSSVHVCTDGVVRAMCVMFIENRSST